MKELCIIVVDTETSGLYPGTHGLVGIGAVLFTDNTDTFSVRCRVEEYNEISKIAQTVNGLSEEEMRSTEYMSAVDAYNKFIEWATSHGGQLILAGHNIRFDYNFLRHVSEQPGALPWPFGYRTLDIHTVVLMATGRSLSGRDAAISSEYLLSPSRIKRFAVRLKAGLCCGHCRVTR